MKLLFPAFLTFLPSFFFFFFAVFCSLAKMGPTSCSTSPFWKVALKEVIFWNTTVTCFTQIKQETKLETIPKTPVLLEILLLADLLCIYVFPCLHTFSITNCHCFWFPKWMKSSKHLSPFLCVLVLFNSLNPNLDSHLLPPPLPATSIWHVAE